MKLGSILSTFAALLLSAHIAFADAASKAKQIDDIMATPWGGVDDFNDMAIDLIRDAVQNDMRIEPGEKKATVQKLLTIGDPNAASKRMRQLWNHYFTEDEIKYIHTLSQSPMGKKLYESRLKISAELQANVKGALPQEYKKATGLDYPPPAEAKLNGGKSEPNWMTRLVWKISPAQKFACP